MFPVAVTDDAVTVSGGDRDSLSGAYTGMNLSGSKYTQTVPDRSLGNIWCAVNRFESYSRSGSVLAFRLDGGRRHTREVAGVHLSVGLNSSRYFSSQ